MRLFTVFIAGALICIGSASLVDDALFRRSSSDSDPEEAYLDSVCLPANVTDPIPPCIEVIAIEGACQPNGTEPLDILAHAECMCNGGYFSNWVGCLNCDYIHGARSPAIVSAFETILTSASNILCTGTPTASFAAIFSSLSDGVAATGTGTKAISDLYPSNPAVSLYYTADGPQGLGAITGSATLATKTASSVGPSSTKASSGTATGQTTGATGAAGSTSSSASSSTSKAGAVPTNAVNEYIGMMAAGAIAVLML